MSAYAELAVTTNFSFLRGASHPQEYVAEAQDLGLHALGIADRNTLAGVVRAYREAKERGFEKLVVGARLVTRDGFEAIAYPMERKAYGRLCRLLSEGNRRAEKGTCDFGFHEMLAARDGLILLVLPPRRITKLFTQRLTDLVETGFHQTYLVGAHRFDGHDRRRIGHLAELGDRLGAPMIAATDALYHAPDRRPLQDVLTCIREGCTIAEAGYRLEAHAERHLKPPAMMRRLFADHPRAIERTVEIAEACTFSLSQLHYEYPDEPVPPHKTPQQHLEDLTWHGARWRYADEIPATVEKILREELALIAERRYAPYFLTVYDIVRYARDRGILCQGRGSAANSAVCYCLGITAVDPTKHALLFARFISEERNEPPDIDVDFEHERREEVIQYLYERYGRDRAAICATVIHYRPRMAIREVGKALGLTDDITAALSDTVWGTWGDELPDDHVRQAGLDPSNPAIRQALILTNQIIGFPRHLSQHVGGFVLCRDRIDETVPVGPAAMENRTFIEWDKDDIDAIGLMKVDVLALGMLSCLRKGLELLARYYRREIPTLADIPQDGSKDAEAIYEMLSRADSVGVFQVESRAQMSMLPRLRPQRFYDLVVQVAIVRPGPIQGNMVHPYLRRRENPHEVVFPQPHPDHGDADELKNVLQNTYGVPLFQEQAMRIAIEAAKFTPAEADGLRRAMATFRHNGKIHLYRDKFIGGMTARGYPQDFAERCFKQIEGFSTYGFPESHAASFALLVYASAWMKCLYPDVFCAAILNSQPMGFYRPAQLVRDAREHGVEVLHPDVNFSEWNCTLEPASSQSKHRFAVRLGFRQIVGLSEAEIGKLVDARGNGFASVEQLGTVEGVELSTLETLAEADAFRSLDLDRRAALWAVRGLDGFGWRRSAPQEIPLLAPHLGDGLFQELPVALKPMTLGEQVAEDYLSLGLSLKAHPLSFLRDRMHRLGIRPNVEHRSPRLPPNARVTVAGLVLTRQRPGTAKGVVFLTLEDETGIANIIVWRDRFEAYRRIVMTSRFLAVRGKLQRAGEVVHVLAEDLLDLSADLRRLRDDEPHEAPAPSPADTLGLKSRDFH
jgi:error-prone DNA polymerase